MWMKVKNNKENGERGKFGQELDIKTGREEIPSRNGKWDGKAVNSRKMDWDCLILLIHRHHSGSIKAITNL